jgi:ubiquinone biosynthesis protein
MLDRGHKAATGPALKMRREEVVARLAAYGLVRGPRRTVRAAPAAADAGAGLGRRLRLALEGLGPIFSSFGLYLASRVDLLDARDCLELAALRDRAAPLHAAAAYDLLSHELGLAPAEAFAEFDGEPFESRLLYQTHRARLRDGTPVVVKLVRPEAERQFLRDIELLDLLEGALLGGASFEGALADFTSALGGRLDLTREASAMASLAADAEGFDMLAVPAIEHGLCSARVLTAEEPSGRRLDGAEPSRASRDREAQGGRDPLNVSDRPALARLLCSVWLRQALLGHAFPAEPLPSNVLVTYDGQIAFTGGLFAGLNAEAQTGLWNYLISTAAENPDRACSGLLGELRREGRAGADEDLRHRFRQVVPFRDTGWHQDDDDTSRLADHLVVHWRSAAECGYVPRPHLPSFYRGLFTIATVARQLSPESDPLLEGLQDARLQESLARVREMLSLRQLGDHSDRYAAMMMGLPGRLDEMLTLASGGAVRLKVRAADTPAGRSRQNSAASVTALLLLLAGAVVLLPRVSAALVGEVWANRIGTLVFILLGALVLRAAGRTV